MNLHGKSASHGIVVGRVRLVQTTALLIDQSSVQNVDAEIARFRACIAKAKIGLEAVRDRALKNLGADKAAIFDAHLLILEDPELVDTTVEIVGSRKLNALAAFDEVARQAAAMFEAMDNEYMRERAADVRDVADRVLRQLAGVAVTDLSEIQDEVVLVCRDLAPSETAAMNPQKILGILTDLGGKTSHTAIVARTLEIPAVLGLRRITEVVTNGDWIAFDGETGEVVVNPDDATRAVFLEKQKIEKREKLELMTLVGQSNTSADGRVTQIVANIGSPEDLPGVRKYDAAGVGLYRTEFLFMDRTEAPSEEEQFQAYKAVLEGLAPLPVTIRTLDVGGDKPLAYLDIGHEDNPFLGYRAIRYCLEHPEILRTQFRAMLRASAFGNLRIMFPMIASLEELLAAKEHLEAVRKELVASGVKIADHVPVGVMIEIPSAAIISDILAQHCEFLSIGTNDLIQYTVAVDRLNERVQNLYDPFHPAVLRLMRTVIENAHKFGRKTSVCGEMGGSEAHLPLLLGMGLDEFSMAPTSILRSRRQLSGWTMKEAEALRDEVMKQSRSADIESILMQAEARKRNDLKGRPST
ncbi:MAG: phosphoenolpyruvate--protein phosphotransferase [Bdellovibrionota bacterium]